MPLIIIIIIITVRSRTAKEQNGTEQRRHSSDGVLRTSLDGPIRTDAEQRSDDDDDGKCRQGDDDRDHSDDRRFRLGVCAGPDHRRRDLLRAA